jgi:hypothetical protein
MLQLGKPVSVGYLFVNSKGAMPGDCPRNTHLKMEIFTVGFTSLNTSHASVSEF